MVRTWKFRVASKATGSSRRKSAYRVSAEGEPTDQLQLLRSSYCRTADALWKRFAALPNGKRRCLKLDRSETRIRCRSAVLARAPDVRRSFPTALRLPLSVQYVHVRMIMITILDGDIRAAKIRKCVLLQGQKKTNKIDGDMNITVTEKW